MIPWLGLRDPFPPVEEALVEPNGLLAAGGDLSAERLVDAYSRGIFPWFSDEDPVLWWSPDPRMVLFPGEFHVARTLRRAIRGGGFTVTFDRAFQAVVEGCAGPRANQDGTWITGDMLSAYTGLAGLGFAHSVDVWMDGELVGGLYGVALGRMFYGESMFGRATNASKVALAYLARQLHRWSFDMVDCQMSTSHLASLGAREIPRHEFVARLGRATAMPPLPSPWTPDEDLMRDL
jgi:leucyl/phenylalanyl-tRNA---protein transferase